MPYELAMRRSALDELAALDEKTKLRVAKRLDALRENPRPRGVKPYKSLPGGYRIRVGSYRVLFCVDDAGHVIDVRAIRHRKDAYRKR